MPGNTVDLANDTAEKVSRILFLLEGDELRPGLVALVKSNVNEIESIKRTSRHSSTSTRTLLGVAWVGLFLVPFLTLFDRMVLISEVRHSLGLYGLPAVGVSLGLGLMAKIILIFVVDVFVLKWLGWGRING